MTNFKKFYSTPKKMAKTIARNSCSCNKAYYDLVDLFCRYIGDGGNRKEADAMMRELKKAHDGIAMSMYKEATKWILEWLSEGEGDITNYTRVTCTMMSLATYVKKIEQEVQVEIIDKLEPIFASLVREVYPAGCDRCAEAVCVMINYKIKHDNSLTLSREISKLSTFLEEKYAG